MPDRLSMWIGDVLYHRSFPLYRLLYSVYKNRQDAVEIAWMRRLIRPGSCVLDIGANIGFYTLLLADLVGRDGHIYAFEPDAMNFARLSAAAVGRSNVTLERCAVSDRSGPLPIYSSPRLNVDHRTYKVDTHAIVTEVTGVSIDEYVAGRFQVDAIKMDIQGYEPYAFRGMARTIEVNPAMLIFCELWPHGLRQCGTEAGRLYDDLRSQGFGMWLPERRGLRPVTPRMVEELPDSEAAYSNVLLSRSPIGGSRAS